MVWIFRTRMLHEMDHEKKARLLGHYRQSHNLIIPCHPDQIESNHDVTQKPRRLICIQIIDFELVVLRQKIVRPKPK